jgi:glucan biosynthesis protein C
MLIVFMPLDPLIRPTLGKEIYPDGTGLWIMRTMELPLAYLMSLALFRMLAWAVNKQSRTVTFFVDGALAIYLFHLVWAMILLPQARALPISPELQWLVTSIMVLALSSLGYLVVRANNITSILFCGVPQKS